MKFNPYRQWLISFFLCLLLGQTFTLAQKGEFTLSVVDSETKRPMEFRLEVRNARGIAQRVAKIPFLYEHMSVPKEGVAMKLPIGTYPMKIERGLEYLPVSGHFVLNRSAKDTRAESLKRFIHLAERGWWSGDLLVLRNPKELETLMLADDVHFVPLMNTVSEDAAEKWFDHNRVYTQTNYFLDHADCRVSIFNFVTGFDFAAQKLEESVSPIPMLYALKEKDERIRFDLVDAESWDVPTLAALGMIQSYQLLGPHILPTQILPSGVDWKRIPKLKKTTKLDTKRLVEDAQKKPSPATFSFSDERNPVRYGGPFGHQRWTEDVYFQLLNAGLQIPPSAGSGSGLSPNPVGSNRMYVFVDRADYESSGAMEGFERDGANAGFSPACWWDGVDNGAVVVTNGPLLQPRVDGGLPGTQFTYDEETPVKLEVAMTLSTRSNIRYIDVIVNGKVTQSIQFQEYAKAGRLPAVELDESGWFLLRVVTEDSGTYCCAMTAPFYVQLGKKRNPLQAAAAQFFLNWEKERVKQLEASGAFTGKNGALLKKLHQFTLEYWQKKIPPKAKEKVEK